MKWNEALIILMIALPFQKIVIAAAARIGILAAHRRAMFIDCASALSRMKKLASAFEDIVFAMAHHAAIFLDELGVFALRLAKAEAEAFSQPSHIALCHYDPIIGTTITRALGAIVKHGQFFHLVVR